MDKSQVGMCQRRDVVWLLFFGASLADSKVFTSVRYVLYCLVGCRIV